MEVEQMIGKEEIEIDGQKFAISMIPAIQAQGIYGKVVRSTEGVGDIGMTFLPPDVSKELLSWTAFQDGNAWFVLDNDERMNRAFKSVLTLIKLEAAMIRKNFGFLLDGRLLEVLNYLRQAGK